MLHGVDWCQSTSCDITEQHRPQSDHCFGHLESFMPKWFENRVCLREFWPSGMWHFAIGLEVPSKVKCNSVIFKVVAWYLKMKALWFFKMTVTSNPLRTPESSYTTPVWTSNLTGVHFHCYLSHTRQYKQNFTHGYHMKTVSSLLINNLPCYFIFFKDVNSKSEHQVHMLYEKQHKWIFHLCSFTLQWKQIHF
jgi:hypothetical protein